jgi:hypothetical protein
MSNIIEDDARLSKALDILSEVSSNLAYEKICKLTTEQLEKYNKLINDFEKINNVSAKDLDCPEDIDRRKGEALEVLAAYLLSISGSIFEVYKNIRTKTNELDQFAVLTTKGKLLMSRGIIDNRLLNIIGECKNYNKRVNVTYVGKFCSLLLSTSTKIGILFSYHGVTGKNWNEASGLIKKFHLHKENESDRYCIIDFNITDFKAISTGKNLLEIIDERLISLKYDTDFSKFLSKHENEGKF